MCFSRRCGIPWNAKPPFLGHYNPPPYGHMRPCMWSPHFRLGHSSDIICNSVTAPSQLCRYCPLWNPCPSRFCSPSKHTTMGEKASTHWREIIPYKHILMCFPRWCWIPWNVRPSFLGHYSKWILAIYNMKSKNKMNIKMKWTFNYSHSKVIITTVLNS